MVDDVQEHLKEHGEVAKSKNMSPSEELVAGHFRTML